MTRLKLADVLGEKPIKLTVELPARVHRELVSYAIIVNGGSPEGAPAPAELVAPMLERFIASDRDYRRARQNEKGRS